MIPNPSASPVLSRRRLFRLGGGLAAGSALLGGCVPGMNDNNGGPSDQDILNFALNLEYLEAEYYARATGQVLVDVGANPGAVTGGTPVVFTDPNVLALAQEITADEIAHVKFLRTALGAAAVSRPVIDLAGGFTAAARAAGVVGANETFDPFASEENFLLGAFLFEDVGVTAYQGAAPLIDDPLILAPALSIHATEAYHAAAVRTYVIQKGVNAQTAANKISDARDLLDGVADLDQGVTNGPALNYVPADAAGLTFPRLATQVLNIVYLTPGTGISAGGFFPSGVNGAIRTT